MLMVLGTQYGIENSRRQHHLKQLILGDQRLLVEKGRVPGVAYREGQGNHCIKTRGLLGGKCYPLGFFKRSLEAIAFRSLALSVY